MIEVLSIGYAVQDIIEGSTFWGGAAVGVAVNTRRLGQKSHLLTTIGDDLASNQLVQFLEKEGVNTKPTLRAANAGLIQNIVNHSDRTKGWHDKGIQAAMETLNLDSKNVPVTDVVISSSAYPKLIMNALRHLLPTTRLAFSPGPKVVMYGGKYLDQSIIDRSEWLFFNSEEWDVVKNLYNIQNPSELRKGTQKVIVTKGQAGANVATESGTYSISAIDVERVIDVTGAGDAFALGFVLAYTCTQSSEVALRTGTLLASKVIQDKGVFLQRMTVSTLLDEVSSSAPEVTYEK